MGGSLRVMRQVTVKLLICELIVRYRDTELKNLSVHEYS